MHVSHLPVTELFDAKAQMLVTDRPRMATSQHHDLLQIDKKKSHPRRIALDL
jgi:hypothetical protein